MRREIERNAVELCGKHADDSEWLAVDEQSGADSAVAPSEALRPVPVADDDETVRFGEVGGTPPASALHADAEDRKELLVRQLARDWIPIISDGDVAKGVSRHDAHGLSVTERGIEWIRDAFTDVTFRLANDVKQLLGMRHAKPRQERRIDEGKNRGIGSDADA